MQNNANFNLIELSVRRVSRNLLRDFNEIQRLQTSIRGAEQFASRSWKKSEKQLKDELLEARGNYGWTSPQFGKLKGPDPTRRWIANAVVGKINFLHGVPHWAVSVALEQKGKIEIAAIYDAFRNEFFGAQRGKGCWLNDSRMRVSRRGRLQELLISTIPQDRDNGGSGLHPCFSSISASVRGIRITGSPALDLAYIAAARMDGFWAERLDECDVAAGRLIAEEAGGITTGIVVDDEQEIDGILAVSGEMFDQFSKLFLEAGVGVR